MSMDLTGITNKNEYYTNHYFSTVFEENASGTISGWSASAKESEELHTPWSMLRQNARQFYVAHDRYVRSSLNLQILSSIRSLADLYLKSLGYFCVGDVDEYDAVKSAVEAADIDWERYDLIDRNGNLATMSSNFHDLEKISKVLIVLTFAAGFVILFLIFLFWTKNRNQEIGILLSLGFRKVSVIGQFLMEALLITLLSFGVTVALAPVASEAVADYLIAAQVEQAEIQRDRDAGKVMFASQQAEQTVMGVDVKITEEMWLLSGAGVIVLIVVSIGIAGIPVLRKKPREILSELS